jgi:hypothetical protein
MEFKDDARTRTAVIEVAVPWKYLTDNGEATEEAGWEEIERNLQNHLIYFNRYRDSKVPNARFIEWEATHG